MLTTRPPKQLTIVLQKPLTPTCFGPYWQIIMEYNKFYKPVAKYIGLLHVEELLEMYSGQNCAVKIISLETWEYMKFYFLYFLKL